MVNNPKSAHGELVEPSFPTGHSSLRPSFDKLRMSGTVNNPPTERPTTCNPLINNPPINNPLMVSLSNHPG